MTVAPKIQGWCPGALRPMQSGDGLLLRAKTTHPRLSARQAREIASIAQDCGNGLVDLSQRAQLQLRGVSEAKLEQAQSRLAALGLLAEDAATESLLNFLVSPFADAQASALVARLAQSLVNDAPLRDLPGKFGFLVDDGGALGLSASTMDIRLEAHGENIAVIADGAREHAFLATPETASDVALALARAFLVLRKGREFELRRMRNVVAAFGLSALMEVAAHTPTPYTSRCRAASAAEIFGARLSHEGGENGVKCFAGVGAPSGRLRADDLHALAALAEVHGLNELRLTPWRALLLPCADLDAAQKIVEVAGGRGLVIAADDPRLSVIACPGAPECPQAHAPTRDLAEILAPLAARLASEGARLHISGCAKGCASPAAAKVALVATPRGFDLIDNGCASDAPTLRGLGVNEIEDAMRARIARCKQGATMSGALTYIRDGAAIYDRSFAIIRAEARLERFSREEERVAVRIIHACGMVEIADDIVFSPGFAEAASAALRNGAPILCDANMVAHGVTRARLPTNNEVICTLADPRSRALAEEMKTTRSAAAMELWREKLSGAVVAIGNAPTSLFRLLEMLDEGVAPPAAIVAMPVGFVGAAESKEAALADGRVPTAIVRGRKGGSAMAAAAINALASEKE